MITEWKIPHNWRERLKQVLECPSAALLEHNIEPWTTMLNDGLPLISKASLRWQWARFWRRSLALRHMDTGSHHGPERELKALTNPFYNLAAYGIHFVASPRHADVLVLTGPITKKMRDPLLYTFYAMPKPRKVLPVGACAQRLILTRQDNPGDAYSTHDPYGPFYDTKPGKEIFVSSNELKGPLFDDIYQCSGYYEKLDTLQLNPVDILKVLITIDPLMDWNQEHQLAYPGVV